MDFTTALQKIGFSPLEAIVYTTLSKHGSLTGYEVAKLCGISRSNVYAALYSLQDKGKCYVSEAESTKYIAIPKDELILSTKKEMEEILLTLENEFPESIKPLDPYITITGYDNVIAKIKHSILLCKSHLYILSKASYIDLFKEELVEISGTKKITILCDETLDLSENITVYSRRKAPQGFHMIVDTQVVITGELSDSFSQCLYTSNESLVRLMRESFITELEMIKLMK
jgi:sugar-specific transcriptional regulator TrmB